MIKASLLAVSLLALSGTVRAAESPMPRYQHVIVIIEENHSFDEIIGNRAAPNINRLARDYGLASNFYAEVHPSEGNYVAMLGGDSFGIHDDDAFWCRRGDQDKACPHASSSDYVDHSIDAPSLTDQLSANGLSWKGYFEDIPASGSKLDRSVGPPPALYAAKHNGFLNFKSVQDDPALARKIVGFDALAADLANGQLPSYAQIVPNQCNDMHGLAAGQGVAEDCRHDDQPGLIRRADALIGKLVAEITASKIWSSPGHVAIIVTWDEGGNANPTNHEEGCCGASAGNMANFGGGWIPTLVITNHGPRGLTDPTPYNHYSLLRSIEDGFGIDSHLGHAADQAEGVVSMTPLFAPPSR